MDNALSQKAEDTLSEFAAVKKAEVNFQTSLGERKGQLGINLIGAFAERQNNAFGWQVRVYGAQQDGKGFNAGVFYRHITDIALFGANAFVDYENHKLGNFYRYSIGGEAQNKYGSFAANYYVPITDEKRKDGGVIFSRKGYDAKLRLNIPNAKFLKAAVDYYNFGDEYGAESDDGFRYGAEAHLIPGLRLGLFYDDGGEELGGEVSYIHTIGEVQQSQTTNEQWTPDLFAAISREHSQRIISVQAIQLSLMPMVPIQTTLVPSQTITTIITTRTEMVMREANVDFTSSYVAAAFATIVSFGRKILATLPPATASRPYVLTIMRDLNDAYSGVNGGGGRAIWPPSLAGNNFGWLNDVRTWTIIIAEGSEDFTGVMITTATETEMTNRMTTFLTTTIGATDYDNSIPPGFSPSFPPSFPQVPKLALAAPVIPAKAGIQTFSRHSRVCVAGAGIQHTNAAACGGKGANAPLI